MLGLSANCPCAPFPCENDQGSPPHRNAMRAQEGHFSQGSSQNSGIFQSGKRKRSMPKSVTCVDDAFFPLLPTASPSNFIALVHAIITGYHARQYHNCRLFGRADVNSFRLSCSSGEEQLPQDMPGPVRDQCDPDYQDDMPTCL